MSGPISGAGKVPYPEQPKEPKAKQDYPALISMINRIESLLHAGGAANDAAALSLTNQLSNVLQSMLAASPGNAQLTYVLSRVNNAIKDLNSGGVEAELFDLLQSKQALGG
jgi:hypothetical protein